MASDPPPELKEELFDQFLQTTPHDLVWVFSAEWDELVFLSDGYEELWGRSRDTLEDDPEDFLNGIHPDDRDAVRDTMEGISAGESKDIEFRVIPDEESRRWIWAHGEPIRDDTGEIVRVAGFVLDITARKERERELEQYHTIIETVPDGVYVLDADFRFSFVNDALIEMTGYQREDLLGSQPSLIFSEDALQEAHRIRKRLKTGNLQLGQLETEIQTATGDRIPCEIRGQLFDEPEGSEPRTAGIIRDVSDRKARERQLQRQNERLNKFASVVSHDLRNPLNVAQGRVELVQEECDSEHLDSAADALDRSFTLIDDLLTLAREGSRVDETEPVDLANTAEECWRNVETADATLDIESEQTIQADESRLQQLVENLLRNAVEYGGEDVTVTIDDLDDGFYVADDGPGIPEDERDEVFDLGYSTKADGTGFGLYIVDEIADAHDWDVTITESESDGTRFEFTDVTTLR